MRMGGQTKYGIFTDRPGTLTNDFFVKPCSICPTRGNKSAASDGIYEGTRSQDRRAQVDGDPRFDLVFGSNSELRAVAEVYASAGGEEKVCGATS